jgi:DnaK suppressor protein
MPNSKTNAKAKPSAKLKTKPKSGAHVEPKFRITDTQLLRLPAFRGEKKKSYDALLALREKISSQMKFHSDEALDAVKNSSGELTSMSTHMADAGSDNFMHDMELNLMTSEGNVIELIDEAIERLVDDEYGKCIDCGCNINPERLEAIPYAQCCIRCKSAREKNGGIFPMDAD